MQYALLDKLSRGELVKSLTSVAPRQNCGGRNKKQSEACISPIIPILSVAKPTAVGDLVYFTGNSRFTQYM